MRLKMNTRCQCAGLKRAAQGWKMLAVGVFPKGTMNSLKTFTPSTAQHGVINQKWLPFLLTNWPLTMVVIIWARIQIHE